MFVTQGRLILAETRWCLKCGKESTHVIYEKRHFELWNITDDFLPKIKVFFERLFSFGRRGTLIWFKEMAVCTSCISDVVNAYDRHSSVVRHGKTEPESFFFGRRYPEEIPEVKSS